MDYGGEVGEDGVAKDEGAQEARVDQGDVDEDICAKGVADANERTWWPEGVYHVDDVSCIVHPAS